MSESSTLLGKESDKKSGRNDMKQSTNSQRMLPRVIDRSSFFCQSKGCWKVNQIIASHTNEQIESLFRYSSFFSLLEYPTPIIILVLLLSYAVLIFLFGILFYILGSTCGEECIDPPPLTILEGTYFSLETVTAIGYDTDKIFFGGYMSPLFLVYFARFAGLVFEICAVSVVLLRMTRANQRSASVIFSKYAVIRKIGGQHCFMFRCFEMRTNTALIEAHVRCYVVRHTLKNDAMLDSTTQSNESPSKCVDSITFQHLQAENSVPISRQIDACTCREDENKFDDKEGDEGIDGGDEFSDFFQSFPMRIQHPDDELGGMLLLTVPNTVVHRLDAWSPLIPPKVISTCIQQTEAAAAISTEREDDHSSYSYKFPQVLQRQSDYESGNRTCRNKDFGISLDKFLDLMGKDSSPNTVMDYLRQTEAEVVVIVEGIEPLTSCTVQARCSYTVDEIRWGHEFVNCVGRNADGTCDVYLDKFLETRMRVSKENK